MKGFFRKNEKENKGSGIMPIDLKMIELLNSICKIEFNIDFSTKEISTGFLIKLYDENEILCLMTNEHVIKKEMVESQKVVDIFYENGKKYLKLILDSSKRIIKCDKNLDITIIQIFNNEIKENYFLLPYLGNRNLINRNIYLLHYPGGQLSYSEGSITNVDNDEITHNAETKKGSSGSPIILKDTYEVIGIHKQKNTNIINTIKKKKILDHLLILHYL